MEHCSHVCEHITRDCSGQWIPLNVSNFPVLLQRNRHIQKQLRVLRIVVSHRCLDSMYGNMHKKECNVEKQFRNQKDERFLARTVTLDLASHEMTSHKNARTSSWTSRPFWAVARSPSLSILKFTTWLEAAYWLLQKWPLTIRPLTKHIDNRCRPCNAYDSLLHHEWSTARTFVNT